MAIADALATPAIQQNVNTITFMSKSDARTHTLAQADKHNKLHCDKWSPGTKKRISENISDIDRIRANKTLPFFWDFSDAFTANIYIGWTSCVAERRPREIGNNHLILFSHIWRRENDKIPKLTEEEMYSDSDFEVRAPPTGWFSCTERSEE